MQINTHKTPYKHVFFQQTTTTTTTTTTKTLANAIYAAIGEEHMHYIAHDSYYKDASHLSMEERQCLNFDHPDSLDTALLVEHLKQLKARKNVDVPTYDFSTHCRVSSSSSSSSLVATTTKNIILVEGILIFCDEALLEQIDIRVFVDTDDDLRLIRRISRDMKERGRTFDSVIDQYMKTVRPMHDQYVRPSMRKSDIIVPEGLNNAALELVVSKLRSHLQTSKL